MRAGSVNYARCAVLIMVILPAMLFTGCESENPALGQATSGAVEPFDRDRQEYFFKLPEGCIPVRFELSYWMPSLGAGGPDPNFWKSFYLSKWEMEKRGIEVEKITITVNGTERELARDEKVVVLIVPGSYESWYSQAYELEMFDDIRMIYERSDNP